MRLGGAALAAPASWNATTSEPCVSNRVAFIFHMTTSFFPPLTPSLVKGEKAGEFFYLTKLQRRSRNFKSHHGNRDLLGLNKHTHTHTPRKRHRKTRAGARRAATLGAPFTLFGPLGRLAVNRRPAAVASQPEA